MRIKILLFTKHSICLLLLIATALLHGCKKMIEVDSPGNQLVGKEIYNSNATAASVLTGMYIDMSNNGIFTGSRSISLATGLSADELINTTGTSTILNSLYTNSLTNNGGDLLFWSDLYALVYRSNSVIEGLTASLGITPAVKQQLVGEAKFLRAFYYFYLVNLYGDVPLLLSTDIKANTSALRTDKAKVYEQIINDLREAQTDLSEAYVGADAISAVADRLRPNKTVASALLARVYLYTEQWSLAEQEADKVIANSGIYQIESPENVFLSSSREAIWQLQPVITFLNTMEATVFVLAAGPDNSPPAGPDGQQFGRPVYLSDHVYNAFEAGDARKANWVGTAVVEGITYPYAYKYKLWQYGDPLNEYLVIMRLAEQHLIRAEARAQQNKLTGANSAASDIDVIRLRAGLLPTIATSQGELLDVIYKERQLELFTEFGHRWLDLKRSNRINQVMSAVAATKGANWIEYKSLYPIPVLDIQRNPNLQGQQNPGYPEL
jgi:starch-binding outer membrane protein, SusD/RagB family